VWDASTGAELNVLKGHTNPVTSVAFSSDGTRIASGSYGSSVRVWDASTGAELDVLQGHTNSVNSVTFSSDGTQIVPGSDEIVRLSTFGSKHFVWNVTETNWIISCPGKDHLMWVPPEAQLKQPSNILIISRDGFGSVDFTQSMIGAEWAACYTPFQTTI
jgi:WD40 repeat protein